MPWLPINDDVKTGAEALGRFIDGYKRRAVGKVPIVKVVPLSPSQSPAKTPKQVKKLPRVTQETMEAIRYKPHPGNAIKPGNDNRPIVQRSDAGIGAGAMRKILDAGADVFKLPKEVLIGCSRRYEYVMARHICMYVTATLTGRTLPEIGRFYRKDHTSVLYAIRRIEAMIIGGEKDVVAAVNTLRDTVTQKFTDVVIEPGSIELISNPPPKFCQPRKARLAYSDEDLRVIQKMHDAGKSVLEISIVVGRSEHAILTKIVRIKELEKAAGNVANDIC